MWIIVNPQLIENKKWSPITLIVDKLEKNPYKCCDIIDCTCENTNSDSCSSFVNNLQEGECNGYLCCNRKCVECVECDCTYYGEGGYACSTCCYCTYNVFRVKCKSACGNCYTPIVTMTNNMTVFVNCGRNDTVCVDNFFKNYKPIGSEHDAYYDENKNIKFHIDPIDFYGVIIPSVLTGCIMFVIFIRFLVSYM